jgi:hypothetical protein
VLSISLVTLALIVASAACFFALFYRYMRDWNNR